jgi:hypothetical protein
MYYTYAYLREDKTPYYIGKGTGNRAYVTHKRKNGQDLKPKNKDQIIILKHFDIEEQAYIHEKYMIFLYGLKINGGLLINLTLGGDGGGRFKYSSEERDEAYKNKDKERRLKCRDRERQLERERRKKNREKINEVSKQMYWNKREEKLKYAKEYREKNREEINKKQREKRKKIKLAQSL